LIVSLTNKLRAWEAYIESGKFSNPLPEDWERKLDLFDKVLLSRVIQPQKILAAMNFYVTNTIGQQYLDPPNVTVKDIWKDSDNRTPIIFVLSPGADPTSGLLKFAQSP
jgi:dynein heavy chain